MSKIEPYRLRPGDSLLDLSEEQREHFLEWSSLWGDALLHGLNVSELHHRMGNGHVKAWKNLHFVSYESASSTLSFRVKVEDVDTLVKIRGWEVTMVAAKE